MKDAVKHWQVQRLSGLLLVPLSLWFVGGIIQLAGAEWSLVRDWLGAPFNAGLGILLFLILFRHLQLGLDVVIDDYVHTPAHNARAQTLVRIICTGNAFLCIAALITLTLRA